MRSVVVVLPASMWAMIPKLRSLRRSSDMALFVKWIMCSKQALLKSLRIIGICAVASRAGGVFLF